MWEQKDKYWVFPLFAITMIMALPFLPLVALYDLIRGDHEEKNAPKLPSYPQEKNRKIKRVSDGE